MLNFLKFFSILTVFSFFSVLWSSDRLCLINPQTFQNKSDLKKAIQRSTRHKKSKEKKQLIHTALYRKATQNGNLFQEICQKKNRERKKLDLELDSVPFIFQLENIPDV